MTMTKVVRMGLISVRWTLMSRDINVDAPAKLAKSPNQMVVHNTPIIRPKMTNKKRELAKTS
jgi:hypothetical protein